MTKTLICGIAMAIAARTEAQVTFQRVIGGVYNEEATCATTTSDGGYVIGGYTYSLPSDAWFVKLDPNGNVLWSRTFGDAGSEKAYDIQEHSNGQLWCTGSSDFDVDGSQEAFLLIMDASGYPVWSDSYDPIGIADGLNFAFTADGGAVLTMYAQDLGITYGVVRVDQNGAVLWKKNYVASTTTYGGGIAERPNGDLLCVGSTFPSQHDVLMLQLDANGIPLSNTSWSSPGNPDEGAYIIEPLSDGGYLVAGETHGQGAGPDNVLLIRMDSSLNTAWARAYGTTGRWLRSFAAGPTPDGGFFSGVHDYSADGNEDMGLMRTDASGILLWARAYGDVGTDVCHKAIACPDGGFLVVGYTENFGASGRDMYVVKTDVNGNVTDGAQLCYCDPVTLSETTFMYTNPGYAISWSDAMVASNFLTPGWNYVPTLDTTLCGDLSTGLADRGPELQLMVFPLPCIDQVTIDLGVAPAEVVAIELLDVLGRSVLSARTSLRSSTLDVSRLAPGEHLLIARSSKWVGSRRITVLD